MPSTTGCSCPWTWATGSTKDRAARWCPPPAPEAQVEGEYDISEDLLRADLVAAEAKLSAAQAELETYKRLYDRLLDRVVGGAA